MPFSCACHHTKFERNLSVHVQMQANATVFAFCSFVDEIKEVGSLPLIPIERYVKIDLSD